MFHKVKEVHALPDNRLSVQFAEGQRKIYKMDPLKTEYPVFDSLCKDEDMFYQVRVDVGGYGISWNDEIDISSDELWDNGEVVESKFDGLIALSDACELWGLNESTLRKAISYGKLIPGVDVCKFGKQWVVSKDAMLREYGNA